MVGKSERDRSERFPQGEERWTTRGRPASNWKREEQTGCQPKLVVPDNTRTGVNRACRYEPDLNRTYHEMALHYGLAVLPARPYKPRDKAKAEGGVQVVQRWTTITSSSNTTITACPTR